MRTLYTFDKHNYSDDMEVLSASRCARLLSETASLPCSRPVRATTRYWAAASMQARPTRWRWHVRCARRQGFLSCRKASRECGKVIEKRRDIFEADKIYYCHTYVYFCDVKDEHVAAQMTDSEIRLEYHLSWATPDEIIKANSAFLDKEWIARDTKIVELIKEMC